MKKVLWLSRWMPYDAVDHAGGKTHNFFLKNLSIKYDIVLVSFSSEKTIEKSDLEKYGIKNHIIVWPRRLTVRWYAMACMDMESMFNPFNRYGGLIRNYSEITLISVLKKLQKSGYQPDIIIMEWTEIFLLQDKIRQLFPNAKTIGVEVDVSFLKLKRIYESVPNRSIQKWIKRKKYEILKKKELSAIRKADAVILNNFKDKNLLTDSSISESGLHVLPPYFDDYSNISHEKRGDNILFWGAMGRVENWQSAVWFIENVMPLLEDLDIQFVVIGSNPNERLLNLQSNRVKVTGFVEDVSAYFKDAFCMVVPLVLGAGVKVKVIEGLSAGLPILANDIATEGIPVLDGENYFRCITAEEYSQKIHELFHNHDLIEQMSEAGRKLVKEHYDLKKAVLDYEEIIDAL